RSRIGRGTDDDALRSEAGSNQWQRRVRGSAGCPEQRNNPYGWHGAPVAARNQLWLQKECDLIRCGIVLGWSNRKSPLKAEAIHTIHALLLGHWNLLATSVDENGSIRRRPSYTSTYRPVRTYPVRVFAGDGADRGPVARIAVE